MINKMTRKKACKKSELLLKNKNKTKKNKIITLVLPK